MVPRVSLIPKRFAERRRERVRRARWGLAVVASAFAGAGIVGWVHADRTVGQGSVRHQRTQITSEVARADAAIPQIRRELEKARGSAGASAVLRDRPDWSLLLAMLDQARGDSVTLERVTVSVRGAQGEKAVAGEIGRVVVRVAGIAERQTDAQDFILAVEQSGVFDRAHSLGTRPRELPRLSGVGFEMECEIVSVQIASGEQP